MSLFLLPLWFIVMLVLFVFFATHPLVRQFIHSALEEFAFFEAENPEKKEDANHASR